MEKLNYHLENFDKALNSLQNIQDEAFSLIVRDAALQRFKHTVKLFWKTLKRVLLHYEGIDCASPKKCIREAKNLRWLTSDDTETALMMIDDRNLISHTYVEEIAQRIFNNIPTYISLLKKVRLNVFNSRFA